jgi:cell division protein FtsN
MTRRTRFAPTGAAAPRSARQRGGFAVGLVLGLLLGLALALAVALYITKVPVPFVDRVPQRTAEQDRAEAERLRQWDPNAPLAGRNGARPMLPGAPGAPGAAPPGAPLPEGALPPGITLPPPVQAVPPPMAQPRDPAAILSGAVTPSPAVPGADPFLYFVQAGAYTRADEAEQQRVRLTLMGLDSRITEREQSGRIVYRVRIGPFPTREDADGLQMRLQDGGMEAQIVRVERP